MASKEKLATKLASKVANKLVTCVRQSCAKVYKVPLSASFNSLSEVKLR